MREPNGSSGSDSSSCAFLEIGAAIFGAGAASGAGAAGAAAFFVSNEPTLSLAWYFLRMPSLWYFQNCLDASFPATRVRIFFPPIVVLVRPSFAPQDGLQTWMLILESSQVVHILVNDDVEVFCAVVRRNICGGESLGHGALRDIYSMWGSSASLYVVY